MTEKKMINVALPKGRLGEIVYGMMEQAGYECPEVLDPKRKLTFENEACGVRYFWVKPSDVPIYVERGAADVGFPHIARKYYESQGREISIIKLNGSIEIAPILGLSDVIVDIVETGKTLKENGLDALETIVPISARFIANKASFQFKHDEITAMSQSLSAICQTKE